MQMQFFVLHLLVCVVLTSFINSCPYSLICMAWQQMILFENWDTVVADLFLIALSSEHFEK